MSNPTLTMEYQGREITVEYYHEDGSVYIEGVTYKEKDITKSVNHSKIFAEMPEAMFQLSVIDEENNCDL